ncbi:hypothetical protein [Microcoleus vaginatus]|uniref:hypothetical protein n=1 Tax=Microcoleus vaginatus TaxID=119532 RepID=UPI00168902A0|nr:hypothetical protein [Microcoleus sp. FACHB-45]
MINSFLPIKRNHHVAIGDRTNHPRACSWPCWRDRPWSIPLASQYPGTASKSGSYAIVD